MINKARQIYTLRTAFSLFKEKTALGGREGKREGGREGESEREREREGGEE